MKQNTTRLMTALAVAGGLIIANSSQAQYIVGNGAATGIAMAGGNFVTPAVTTPTGLALSGANYTWGEWDIPVAQQVALNPADNKIIFTYTITGPTPAVAAGGTGAWEWYGLQPLLGDNSGGAYNPQRYFGYDGYDQPYNPGGIPNGQNQGNQDAGYVYNPANQTVTETGSLTAAQQAAIAGGAEIAFFQISMDPVTVASGFAFTVDSIQLVPEPATMALVGLGMAGLVIARRRVSAK